MSLARGAGSGRIASAVERWAWCGRAFQWHPGQLSPVMKQTHPAGRAAFLDFSGKKPRLVDRETGTFIACVLLAQRWILEEPNAAIWELLEAKIATAGARLRSWSRFLAERI